MRRESSLNSLAHNPSGAFGLGQIMPGNRQRLARRFGFHPDTTNPVQQITMMRAYIQERYTTVENALAFWDRNHWY